MPCRHGSLCLKIPYFLKRKKFLFFLLKVLKLPSHLLVLIPSGIYLSIQCEVGIFFPTANYPSNGRVLPLHCHFCQELSSHGFMSVFLELFHQSICLSLLKYQTLSNLFSEKAALTDSRYDIILWVRCECLQEGQFSKSVTVYCAYLVQITSNPAIQ